MTTVMSSKGQVVLNVELRRSLGLSTGTVFTVRRENQSIVLEPVKSVRPKGRIVKDRRSSFSGLDIGDSSPPLTSERVRELLVDFP